MNKFLDLKEIKKHSLSHYPIPLLHQIADKKWNKSVLPVTELIHKEVLSLPVNLILRINDLNCIVKSIKNFI